MFGGLAALVRDDALGQGSPANKRARRRASFPMLHFFLGFVFANPLTKGPASKEAGHRQSGGSVWESNPHSHPLEKRFLDPRRQATRLCYLPPLRVLYTVSLLIALPPGEYRGFDRSADPKRKRQLTVY